MARAVWRGTVQLLLLMFPAKLFLATESKGVAFHLLHEACGSRIQMRTWCPVHDVAITRAETIKGFEYTPGRCVPISDADLAQVPLKTVRTIEIVGFAGAAELDYRIWAQQTYFLAPEPIGERVAAVLAAALARGRLVGVCKVVLTNREHLAVLYPYAGALALTTLHWADEIRSVSDAALPAVKATPAERTLTGQLVAALRGPFDPAAYQDAYRQALTALVEAKVAGIPVSDGAATEAAGTIVDLMAALEASVAAARARVGAPSAGPRAVGSASVSLEAVTTGTMPSDPDASRRRLHGRARSVA